MGAAGSSDFVDPETLPLQILLAEEVRLEKNGKEQNVVDARDQDNDKLLKEYWQLSHEKKYWMDFAQQMEKERNWFGFISLTSPLTQWSEKIYTPHSEDNYWTWKWYKTNCPCCRRPLEITTSSVKQDPWTPYPPGHRHAFVTALWGANAGDALGALVLGSRLRDLSPHIDRVLIHTDDVPSKYLEAFGKNDLWQLRKVQYIDGVSDLYIRKGNIFDGVFTKLAVWTLDDYAKVILLDLDVIPLKPLDNLFELPCPAAMVRGQGEFNHGDKVDGDRFFGAENYHDYPWGQSGRINAGLILLQPDHGVFERMLSEVTCKNHPCHVAGSGPEQDYLSRFFAAQRESPWHHISVAWNYQLHQSIFAIERVMEWRAFMETSVGQVFSQADKEWLPERLRMDLEDIGVVHFSGEVKMWHRILEAASLESGDRRREVSHALDATNGEGGEAGDVAFAERLMSYQRGHDLWISKTAEPEHYQYYGCRRDGLWIFTGKKDITDALDLMAQKVLQVAERAAKVWRDCYEKLAEPGLLEELQKPRVPEGCIQLGTCVEVSWPIGQGSHETVRWFQAQVLGAHDNKDYVVKYHRGGDWGDTERHVHPERVRLPRAYDQEHGNGWDDKCLLWYKAWVELQ